MVSFPTVDGSDAMLPKLSPRNALVLANEVTKVRRDQKIASLDNSGITGKERFTILEAHDAAPFYVGDMLRVISDLRWRCRAIELAGLQMDPPIQALDLPINLDDSQESAYLLFNFIVKVEDEKKVNPPVGDGPKVGTTNESTPISPSPEESKLA